MKVIVAFLMFTGFIASGFAAGSVYKYEWGRAIVWYSFMFMFWFAATIVAIYDAGNAGRKPVSLRAVSAQAHGLDSAFQSFQFRL